MTSAQLSIVNRRSNREVQSLIDFASGHYLSLLKSNRYLDASIAKNQGRSVDSARSLEIAWFTAVKTLEWVVGIGLTDEEFRKLDKEPDQDGERRRSTRNVVKLLTCAIDAADYHEKTLRAAEVSKARSAKKQEQDIVEIRIANACVVLMLKWVLGMELTREELMSIPSELEEELRKY